MMLEVISNDVEDTPIEAFNKAFEKIKSKPGHKYEFYKKNREQFENSNPQSLQNYLDDWKNSFPMDGNYNNPNSQI